MWRKASETLNFVINKKLIISRISLLEIIAFLVHYFSMTDWLTDKQGYIPSSPDRVYLTGVNKEISLVSDNWFGVPVTGTQVTTTVSNIQWHCGGGGEGHSRTLEPTVLAVRQSCTNGAEMSASPKWWSSGQRGLLHDNIQKFHFIAQMAATQPKRLYNNRSKRPSLSSPKWRNRPNGEMAKVASHTGNKGSIQYHLDQLPSK